MISELGSTGGVLAYAGMLLLVGCGDGERAKSLSVPDDAGIALDGSGASDGAAATSGSGGRASTDARAAIGGSAGKSAGGTSGDAGDASDAADAGGTIATCPAPLPPPAGPGICGDGWRNPASEECDDGNTDDTDLCSTACRTLDRLVAPPIGAMESDPPPRYLAGGGSVIASGCDGFGVAYVEGKASPSIAISIFDRNGTARERLAGVNDASLLSSSAEPVIAALPQREFAVAWNDLGGDGHLLGIALKRVDPASPGNSVVTFANATHDFSQYDPDILRAGSEVVVAWVDDGKIGTAPDVRFRRFDLSLSPLSADETLAASPARESGVALTSFGSSWAAAWRSSSESDELIGAQANGTEWQVAALRPGPAGDRPAIVELDGTHLFVVFAAERSTSTAYALKGALLDTARPGAIDSFDIPSLVVADNAVSHTGPTVTRAGARLFLSWRSTSALGSGHAEEVWLKEIAWSSGSNSVTLDLSRAELPLPRAAAHRQGDQRVPRLISTAHDGGQTMVGVWQDFGRVFGAGEAEPDVILELIPAPLLRLPEARRAGR